jgi:D-beta-D-heptose 7-phosphate kinase/D-beta-D-heptose 1-phosphate adenosyltransferase
MKTRPRIYLELLPYLDTFSKVRLLVLGDIMQDIFMWGSVKRISPEAPVPVVRVERETAMLGGAANVVHNLTSLGANVSLAGVVGRDSSGERLLSDLKKMGVDCSSVIKETGRPTSVKTRIIAHSQQVVRFDREVSAPVSAASEKKILARLDGLIKKVNAVVVSDYAKGFITPAIARRVISRAGRAGKPVMVDPKLMNLALFRRATAITPNHHEAGEATGLEAETDARVTKAGKRLIRQLDCRAVLITRGEAGMTLIEANGPLRHIPAQAREVFDVTGAGDTVISTLALGVASGMSFYHAAFLANIAAGIGVGKLGTSVVSRKELKGVLQNEGL